MNIHERGGKQIFSEHGLTMVKQYYQKKKFIRYKPEGLQAPTPFVLQNSSQVGLKKIKHKNIPSTCHVRY